MSSIIMTIITSLLSYLPDFLGGSCFKQKSDLSNAQVELDKQVLIAKYKMSSDIAQSEIADSRNNGNILQATGTYFKYFTFVMWFGPFILGIISPKVSALIFDNLKLMPDWYVQSCMRIMFGIWGISVATPVVGTIFSNLGSYLSDKRADHIEAKRIDNDTYRKAFFDALRAVKGPLTPMEVAIDDKVFDALDKNNNSN